MSMSSCLTPKHVKTKTVNCSTVRAVVSTRRRQFKQEITSKQKELGDKIKLKGNGIIVEKFKSKKNKIYEKTIRLKLVRC